MVMATGIESPGDGFAASVRFGIEHDDGTEVLRWIFCAATDASPIGDWPGSGSWVSLTLDDTVKPDGPRDAVVLGLLVVARPDSGKVRLVGASPEEAASWITPDGRGDPALARGPFR